MPYSEEEKLHAIHKVLGLSDQESLDRIRSQGGNPAYAGASVPNKPEPDEADSLRERYYNERLNSYMGDSTGRTLDPNENADLVQKGAVKHIAGAHLIDGFMSNLAEGATVAWRRGQNLIEQTLGRFALVGSRAQQVMYGALVGEKMDQLKARLLPEVRYAPMEELASQDAVDQLDAAARVSLGRKVGDFLTGKWLDKEPIIMERMNEDLHAEDVVRKWTDSAQGEGAYDTWKNNFRNQHGIAGRIALGAAYFGADWVADPLFIADPAPAVFKLAGKAKGLWQGPRTINTMVHAVEAAEKELQLARQIAEKAPEDANAIKRLVQTEKRAAEARLAMHEYAATGETTQILIRDTPRRDAETLTPTQERAWQRTEARKYAGPNEINTAMREQGFSGLRDLKAKLRHANDAIRGQGPLDEAHYATLNAFERMPQNVKKALHILGYSRERVTRAAGLEAKALNLAEHTDLSHPEVLARAAVLGPSDSRVWGDAAMRMAAGADPSDLTVHGHLTADLYEMLRQGNYPKYGDGFWIRELADGRKAVIENGIRDIEDAKLFGTFPERANPGLVPGSRSLRGQRILDGGTAIANILRQPFSALKDTPVYRTIRAAQGNAETRHLADKDWFEQLFKENGIARRRDRLGRMRFTSEGKASLDHVFNMLDAEDAATLGKHMDAATGEQKKVFHALRGWFDEYADQLGMARSERISNYFPHLFPKHMFENGAKPLEVVGLPVKSGIWFAHLEDRVGKAGYKVGHEALLEGLDAYSRGANRKLFMEPAFQKALDYADLAGQHGLQWQAEYTRELVHDLKGLPRPLDQVLDGAIQSFGGMIGLKNLPSYTKSAMAMSTAYYVGLLAGNTNYLLQNLATGVMNPAARYGLMNTARGILRMGTAEGRKMAEMSGVARQARTAFESEGTLHKISQKIAKMGLVDQSEAANRGFSFHAALSDLVRNSGHTWEELVQQGLHHAYISEAVKGAEFTQHVYGSMGRSPIISKLVGKAGANFTTQFLSFPYKQTEFLMQMGKENPGMLMRYFAYSGIGTRIAAEAGIDLSNAVGLGPVTPQVKQGRPGPISPGIEFLSSVVSLSAAMQGDDPAEVEKAWKVVEQNAEGMIPFVSQIQKASRNLEQLVSGRVEGPGGEFVRPLEPGEKASRLLGLRSVQDRMNREFLDQARESRNAAIYEKRKALRQFIDFVDQGKNDEAEAALMELWNKHGLTVSNASVTGAMEARMLSQRLRVLEKSSEFLPPDMYYRFNLEREVNEPTP